VIEKKGYGEAFQDGHALINPSGYRLDGAIFLRVRERNLYRIKGQPIREVESNKVEENNEQVDPKVEQLRGSQP